MIVVRPPGVLARFWAFVEKGPTCWIWTGAANDSGHGRFRVGGKSVYAHRFSYEVSVGPVPEGLNVLHECDNPRCVRPHEEHAWPGTQSKNVRDAITRLGFRPGSKAHGEAHAWSKLTLDQVKEIRAFDGPQAILADKFGVTRAAISLIKTGKNWRRSCAA